MKKAFWHTELIIDTGRHYPTEELFELMKENLGDRFGKIYTKDLKFMKIIFIDGKDGSVSVQSVKVGFSKRGRISVGIGNLKLKITKKGILSYILGVVTLGIVPAIKKIIDFFAGIFNLEGTEKNRAMMRFVAEEIEKFVNK